jgi:hypothetical protein
MRVIRQNPLRLSSRRGGWWFRGRGLAVVAGEDDKTRGGVDDHASQINQINYFIAARLYKQIGLVRQLQARAQLL